MDGLKLTDMQWESIVAAWDQDPTRRPVLSSGGEPMIYSWRPEMEAVQGASHQPDLSADMDVQIAAASGSSRRAFRDREKSTPQATLSLSKPRARTKTADPLAAMLREKRAAERRGYDAEALMDTDTDLGTSSPTDT
jgi:hypothetical protein